MPTSVKVSGNGRRRPPATTPEARENQMISYAVDLAEKQLRNGTASSQVITHFLKRGSMKEKLEQEILGEQKKLITAKTEAIQSTKVMEKLYKDAIKSFSSYAGQAQGDADDYD